MEDDTKIKIVLADMYRNAKPQDKEQSSEYQEGEIVSEDHSIKPQTQSIINSQPKLHQYPKQQIKHYDIINQSCTQTEMIKIAMRKALDTNARIKKQKKILKKQMQNLQKQRLAEMNNLAYGNTNFPSSQFPVYIEDQYGRHFINSNSSTHIYTTTVQNFIKKNLNEQNQTYPDLSRYHRRRRRFHE